MGRVGFEPTTPAMSRRYLNQARPPAPKEEIPSPTVSYNIIFQPQVSHLKVFIKPWGPKLSRSELEYSWTVIYIIYLTLRFKAGRTETWVSNPIEQKKYTASFIKLNLAIVKPTFLPMLVDILNRLVSFITILRVGCLSRWHLPVFCQRAGSAYH